MVLWTARRLRDRTGAMYSSIASSLAGAGSYTVLSGDKTVLSVEYRRISGIVFPSGARLPQKARLSKIQFLARQSKCRRRLILVAVR